MKKIISIIILLLTYSSNSQWFTQTYEYGTAMSNVLCNPVNMNTGIIIGTYGRCLRTTNGGTNWSVINLGSYEYFHGGCYVFNTGTIYIGASGGVLRKSTNHGAVFFPIPSPVTSIITDIHFTSANIGYIACDTNVIYFTSNGGSNWNVVTTNLPSNVRIYSIYFSNVHTGWCMGAIIPSNRYLIKTSNGGINWTTVNIPSNSYNNFYVAGNDLIIYSNTIISRSTDGGNSWISLNPPPGIGSGDGMRDIEKLYGYLFITTSGPSQPGIYISTNWGSNWIRQFNQSADHMDMEINELAGWALSYNFSHTTVYRTTNGGGIVPVNSTSGEIPHKFELKQNYPNPFNAETKITFSVPVNLNNNDFADIKLLIYDVYGREAEVLFNGRLKPGTYEVKWNAYKYSSGTYFYRLISSNFSKTMKMILVK
ncbi:MAG: YCF48-related protein [Ignavibacteria bacterium]|nr:YCF48-related protein [Ignavibacteria bacterium]